MKHLILAVLLYTVCSIHSQHLLASKGQNLDDASNQKAYKKGVKLFKSGNFVEAEEQFQILLDSGYRDKDLISYQAQVHLELHEPHSAKDVILLAKKRNQDLDFLLAVAHYYLEEFQEAKKELSLIKDTATYHVNDMMHRIDRAIEHYNDAQGYVVQNFGPEVNTKYREYSAVMFDGFEELLFTSRNDSSEYTAHDGMAFETIHDTSIDSLNDWHVADPFEFHTAHEKRHDATVQVYQNGKKLITYHNGRLYKSHRVNNVWEEDGILELHDLDGIDTHCFMADDESFVIFASDYHSYGHNLDLFVCYKNEDKTWTEPEPLSALNTEFDEDAPFLADDSTLYFSSRGHNTLGGFDVFKSTYNPVNKRWNKPVNLDYPINTVAEDIYFSIYGKVGYISSTRIGGYGSLDLYRVLMFNEFKIEGYVINEATKQPIPDAQIEIVYDSLYFRTYSDTTGYYEMFVPVNKDMVVTFNKDGHKLHQEKYFVEVFFREKDNHVYDFHVPHVIGAPTKSANLKDGAEPTLIHMEMHNEFDPQSFVVSIPRHSAAHWSDSLKNFYEKKHIANMAALARKQKSSEGMTSVFYEYNSHTLDDSGRQVIADLYESMLKQGDFEIIVEGHTDTRGSHSYNKRLSLKRAKEVADYLYLLGVEHGSIKLTGMGETDLLHEEEDEAAHSKNRRAEIIFKRM